MTESPESKLLARCRRGDAAAWDAIFDQHYPATGWFVFQLSPEFTRQDVEAICQDAFLSVIRFIDSFQEESRFRTLLFRVAAKRARDFRENHRADNSKAGQSATTSPLEANGMTAAHMMLIRKALDDLGDPCREMIELHYFGDLSHEDIGGMLSLTSNNLSTRLTKCLDQLEAIIFGISSQGVQPSVRSARTMDELLKACGKKRRDEAGAPMTMSAAIRQALQAEVSRIALQAAPEPPLQKGVLTKARPAFAYALFFALLITVSSIWYRVHTSKPPKSEGNFGRSNISVPEETPQEPRILKLQNAGSNSESGADGGFQFGHAKGNAAATSPPPVWKQRFARVLSKGGSHDGEKNGKVEGLLDSFQFETSAGRVYVVDQDGSTYEGPSGPVVGEADEVAKALNKARGVKGETLGFVSAYHFQVTGTNRTLDRFIKFEGKFINPVADSPFIFEKAHIKGHARIGENTDIPIEAVPAPR